MIAKFFPKFLTGSSVWGFVCLSALLFSGNGWAQDATAQLGPNELITKISQDMLKELEVNRAKYRGDTAAQRQLVDKYLLPHFDTQFAAQRVLAKHWREATPEQRKRFIDALYQSLFQSYGEYVADFTADRLKILPLRGEDPNAERAVVHTQVKRDNGSLVNVDYDMRKTPEGWKAWNLIIEGISYVKSLQTDFSSEIDQKGIDAVIQRLEAQNKSGVGYKPKAATAS